MKKLLQSISILHIKPRDMHLHTRRIVKKLKENQTIILGFSLRLQCIFEKFAEGKIVHTFCVFRPLKCYFSLLFSRYTTSFVKKSLWENDSGGETFIRMHKYNELICCNEVSSLLMCSSRPCAKMSAFKLLFCLYSRWPVVTCTKEKK